MELVIKTNDNPLTIYYKIYLLIELNTYYIL